MVVLLLGVVLNPVVANMGDVHELEHGTVVATIGTVDHHDVEPAVADAVDADDNSGDVGHGLMHADHAHGASSPVFPVSSVAVVPQNQAALFPPTAPLTSLQHIAGPFRPPIV